MNEQQIFEYNRAITTALLIELDMQIISINKNTALKHDAPIWAKYALCYKNKCGYHYHRSRQTILNHLQEIKETRSFFN